MTKFIAEIGLNHLGDKKILNRMIKNLVKKNIYGVSVQILEDSYYDNSRPFRKKIEFREYQKISRILKKNKIRFGVATNNIETIKKLKNIRIDFWKIISPQFFNNDLIEIALKTKKDVYLSCGIASTNDIYVKSKKYKKLKFIHTSFSEKINDTNMLAINKIREKINKNISFGLHSNLHQLIISAISLQVDKAFFYVKFNDNKYYPDNQHAINLEDLKKNILNWNKISISFGDGVKKREKLPKWVFE